MRLRCHDGSGIGVRMSSKDVHFLMPALGYPQFAQVCFWTCIERRPEYHVSSATVPPFSQPTTLSKPFYCLILQYHPPLRCIRSWCRLTAASAEDVRLVVALSEAGRSLRCGPLSVFGIFCDGFSVRAISTYSFWRCWRGFRCGVVVQSPLSWCLQNLVG